MASYFLAELGLWWIGKITFFPISNLLLLLASLVLLNVPSIQRRWQLRSLTHATLALSAATLMWTSFGLPPPSRIWQELSALEGFSGHYWLELSQRFLPWQSVSIGIALLGTAYLLNRRVRLMTVAAIGVLILSISMSIGDPAASLAAWGLRPLSQTVAHVPIRSGDFAAEQIALGEAMASKLMRAKHQQGSNDTVLGKQASKLDPEQWLEQFYFAQSHIQLPPPPSIRKRSDSFDILILHICSMAWDDLRATGLDRHPFISEADLVFERFNSAASYSGPAAVRLMRSYCGQTRHDTLYRQPSNSCLLFAQLQESGYLVTGQTNHDGNYENFLPQIQANFGVPWRSWINHREIKHRMTSFNGEPVANDGDLLQAWGQRRAQERSEAPVALYYNSISLHDGNRMLNTSAGSLQTYPTRSLQLLDDLNRFTELIRQSGRRTLLLVVPEHGAAIRGNQQQVQGLREIPLPSITQVPVIGYWLDGPRPSMSANATPKRSMRINQPSSYIALTALISQMLIDPPPLRSERLDNRNLLANYARALPSTMAVAENNRSVVIDQAGELWLRPDGKSFWSNVDGQ